MPKINFAHSPDADDAFMFYGIENKKIDTNGFEIKGILSDIETLNSRALNFIYEATAISFHLYPYIAKNYYLMKTGGSIGYKYGPVLVSKSKAGKEIKGKLIGIPGKWTTAYLLLKIFEDKFKPVFIPFDKIIDEVDAGKIDAGLIIHEGQITYSEKNLFKILDLGEWWFEKTKLPVPLGCNVIRKDLGIENARKISEILKKSILYSIKHKKEAISYASKFARNLNDLNKIEKFVDMYVNNRTIELGDEDIRAIKILLNEGYKKGIIPFKVELKADEIV
ncbi:MAG: ABC transporter substrate-binding protein [Candidatus Altiarchaeum hamiconexum]|uniref:1,4-dihydroxy-6-naphtoate synthase n=1 Tax=Candidatus Altarchaeum hamiconexum TaxID=1803513 RepID=A0A8J7Z2L8_9ARCH|nr:ABC transporter substrate-binding protein [Candidatus Altarchaeum hamiconexum]OIQ05373.1 MAG: ABC transporter substrate-binding protein [Candidatus Altarchaeum sp. CG2_30_32_3053]PIN67014.1 MAG: ABC transporter substrate-binding protein [Candidatus Altarchaeum sp. CG12_big_fil_rev_8_21_14_0_65_33_22]PIV28882.1 MAG: ABC transporter substrate-binding protein [Candidatus Altarchaeum sp. CG03_land_8_20_14_0_80_32_618]PIZ29293.1 MAG: ABC transporter substrate-binding protein [Candidatus Altarchae